MDTINLKAHALKFRSIKEFYNILLADCDAYLPAFNLQTPNTSKEW